MILIYYDLLAMRQTRKTRRQTDGAFYGEFKMNGALP
jgi:hypothetical protein